MRFQGSRPLALSVSGYSSIGDSRYRVAPRCRRPFRFSILREPLHTRNEQAIKARDSPVRYAWYDSPIDGYSSPRTRSQSVTSPSRTATRRSPTRPRRGAAKPLEPGPDWVRDDVGLAREIAELEAYFAGELREFGMAVEPEGTAFRRKVWAVLARIPYGETWSYGELARRAVGRTGAARAAGAANGANPIAIVLPAIASSAPTAASSVTAGD